MRDSITVQTDLFEHREVKPHFINPCCFGEDFAAWLRAELAGLGAAGFTLSDLIQEDYGWGFWARQGKDAFWICVGYMAEGPQEALPEWMVSIDYEAGLNPLKRLFHKPDPAPFARLRDRLWEALRVNPMVRLVED